MSSSSEKGKSGGKKLSANEQLLALQDALTLGVSELQLAAQRLGDHQIMMSTGTNQEKRGVSDVAGIFCVFGNPLTRFSFFSAFF